MKRIASKNPVGLHQTICRSVFDEFLMLIDIEEASASDEVDAWRWSYLRKEVFSKYVGPDTDSADLRRQRAITKWLAVEQRNERTNVRLYSKETFFKWRTPDGDVIEIGSEDVLELARHIVLRVIGPDPEPTAVGNFSGGASTSLTRSLGNVARKFMVKAHVTPAAWFYVIPQLVASSTWRSLNPELLSPEMVKGNELFTVPKNTQIDRVAAKEPDLNMWAQKRLGDLIRGHLRSVGIDLNDQSRNQRLAKKGSQDGSLATLDLSSASDSVSAALVGRLLPPGWFVELNALRSEYTRIDDIWHENQMFSSMGNGFTFELESLLFYSIARAVCTITRVKGRVSVYGDDIIVPSDVSRLLSQVLGFCGFTVNPKKSHFLREDLFRESCGAHWYAGYDVKPFYVKGPLLTQPDLIHFLNSFRRWMDVEPFCHTISDLVRETWWRWAKHVDKRAHGGRDLSSKGSLVTPDIPRWEWRQVTLKAEKMMNQLQPGLYLQTLRLNDGEGLTETPNDALRHLSQGNTPLVLTDVTSTWVLRKKRPNYWEMVLNPRPRW